ncbi:MAG: exonuclease domain-containing protein [Candidatus Moraniibacteriota bacterium]
MDKSNLVFLDTETTGLNKEDRLCQVAFKFQGKEHSALFKPEIPISVEAMAISHITNRMTDDKEVFKDSEMFRRLRDIFNDSNILVAHNAVFDAEILRREGLEINKMIDTCKMAGYLDKEGEIPKYNLQYLRYYFDFEIPDAPAHNALGDIRVLEVIFDYFYDRMKAEVGEEEKIIPKMLEISALPLLIKKFSFGKYLGERVEEVALRDKGYLQWLLGEKKKARENGEDESEDWIYTLEYHLKSKNSLF